MKPIDIIIIGGGIIGLSTALNVLKNNPSINLILLEKESKIATHQTGRNSGVIHSGIYYKPASLKAKNCIKGVNLLLEYCIKKNIPVDCCGKLIIATKEEELPRLEELYNRGKANGVPNLKKVDKEEISQIEPYANGLMALYSPTTAIVDFSKVAHQYAEDIKNLGGLIHCNEKVLKVIPDQGKWVIETTLRSYFTTTIVNCAGLHADKIAHSIDPSISPKQMIPFRGEYYQLKKGKEFLVNGLIYPVPDPQFPFLGVHLSKTMHQTVEAGPNAVLALSREGYSKYAINLKDCMNYLTYSGFWALAKKHWKVGLYEYYRSLSKKAFLKSLQRLIPALTLDDLVPSQSGVRSQIVLPDGKLQDDFLLIEKPGLFHVLNAPSPAATASLAIGETIARHILLKKPLTKK